MAQNGTWERIEPQLYRLKHHTPTGEWTTRYYARFKDWKGVNRKIPAGTDLRGARSKKKLLLGENEPHVDFDTQKTRATTLAQWAEVYLDQYAKDKRFILEDRRHVRVLIEFFSNALLSQITAGKIDDFKQVRKDRLTWRGDPVSVSYCNRELACLRHLLKLAEEKDLIDKAPMVRLHHGRTAEILHSRLRSTSGF